MKRKRNNMTHEEEILIIEHIPFINNYCKKLSKKNNETFEELYSKSIYKICIYIDKYDSNLGTFKAWCGQIIFNNFMDICKQNKKRRIFLLDDIIHLYNAQSDDPFIDKLLYDNKYYCELEVLNKINNEQIVRKYIDKLKNIHYKVFNLMVIKNKSCLETSEILNIPKGTVKSRMSRAKEELKNMINKNDKEII